MERTKSLWFCPFWDQIYCWNTKNLLEIKMFANTVPLGISNNVGARSQKNHRNRVKLSKKKGSQIGSKLPPWGCAKASSGILISKYLPSILSWCQVSASGYLLFSILTRRNNCFFGSCRWVWGHYSSKQRQIELKFWPWGFFIVVQMLFKAFWKFLQRQDVPKIRVFGPTLTSIYFLKMAKNSHWAVRISQNQGPISYQFSMKIIIYLGVIWAKLCLCVICTNGPRVKNQEVTAYN